MVAGQYLAVRSPHCFTSPGTSRLLNVNVTGSNSTTSLATAQQRRWQQLNNVAGNSSTAPPLVPAEHELTESAYSSFCAHCCSYHRWSSSPGTTQPHDIAHHFTMQDATLVRSSAMQASSNGHVPPHRSVQTRSRGTPPSHTAAHSRLFGAAGRSLPIVETRSRWTDDLVTKSLIIL